MLRTYSTRPTPLLTLCAAEGVSVSFLSEHGQLLARVTGFTPGNVMLRRDQYRAADHRGVCLRIAGPMVAAKIANSRTTLLRAVRDHGDPESVLTVACRRMAFTAKGALQCRSLDNLRGIEGEAANTYFAVLDRLVTIDTADGGAVQNDRTHAPSATRPGQLPLEFSLRHARP